MENYSELKFKLLILSLISSFVGILLGYFFGTTVSLYITLGWLVPFLWFGHFLSFSIGLFDFTFGTIDGGLHMDLGWIIKFPIYMIWLFNPFKNSFSDGDRPVSENAFSKILKKYILQVQDSKKKEVITPATIAILNIIATETDPDNENLKDINSKDFIEDIVFKTYSSVSSIEDLEKYCSNLIKKLSKEEAKSLGIGTYKFDEETKKYTYENKKSFFMDIDFNGALKIINKSWIRASNKQEFLKGSSTEKNSDFKNASEVKSQNNTFPLVKLKKFIFYLGGLIALLVSIVGVFILGALGIDIGLFAPVLISTLVVGSVFFTWLNNFQINWYKKIGGKLSERKIRIFARFWWYLGVLLMVISVILLNGLSLIFSPIQNKPKEILNKNEKVNKPSKIISKNSTDSSKSKGIFGDATIEDFLEIVNNDIDNEPENPENYATRGLILFNLKKYQSALRDLSKAIKMNDFIDEEIYLTRGLIYLKKSKKRGDLFEKKGCKDIKIAFEEDNKFEAMTLNEDEISAARKKCKI